MDRSSWREYTTESPYKAAFWAMEGRHVEARLVDKPSGDRRVEFAARMSEAEFERLQKAFMLRYRLYAKHVAETFARLWELKHEGERKVA